MTLTQTQNINNICFFCKKETDNITKEDVFPLWLQKKQKLFSEHIGLLNGTKFPYRKIKVPCCAECNNGYLSSIENKVINILDKNKLSEKDNDILFIWLYKILYGLHYKELFLKENIRQKEKQPTIAKTENLLGYHSTNLFLLYALNQVEFVNFKPYSIFIFDIIDANDDDYFYFDEYDRLFSMIQIGKKGIICSFQDDGYIKELMIKYNPNINNVTIKKSDFADLSAFILTLKTRLPKLPNYLVDVYKSGLKKVRIQPLKLEELQLKEFNIENQLKIMKFLTPFFQELTTYDIKTKKAIINFKSKLVYF